MDTNDKVRDFSGISIWVCFIATSLFATVTYGAPNLPKSYKEQLYSTDAYVGVNWSLQSNSPLIDSADDLVSFTTDITGGARKIGSHIDIGAYEYSMTSGLTTTEDLKSTFYPNPACEQITFSKLVESVQIYSLCGTLLMSVSQVNTIPLLELPRGSYLVRVTDSQGKVTTQILIKQ